MLQLVLTNTFVSVYSAIVVHGTVNNIPYLSEIAMEGN